MPDEDLKTRGSKHLAFIRDHKGSLIEFMQHPRMEDCQALLQGARTGTPA